MTVSYHKGCVSWFLQLEIILLPLISDILHLIRLFVFVLGGSNEGGINYPTKAREKKNSILTLGFYRNLYFLLVLSGLEILYIWRTFHFNPIFLVYFLIFCWSFNFVRELSNIDYLTFNKFFFERIRMNLVLVVTIN